MGDNIWRLMAAWGLGGWLGLCLGVGQALGGVPPVVRQAPVTPALWAAGASPYALALWPHALLTAGGLSLVGVTSGLVTPGLAVAPQCPLVDGVAGAFCAARVLNGWDAMVLHQGLSATTVRRWRLWSDVGQYTGIAAPLLLAFGERVPLWTQAALPPVAAAWLLHEAAVDSVVALETLSVANFIDLLLKYAVRRPRPQNYFAATSSLAAQLSFPSGHTTVTAAGLSCLSGSFARRHPHSPWRYVLGGGSVLLSGLTAYGRVAGGMHFYSDVLAGLLLGGTLGYFMPMLYERQGVSPGWQLRTLPKAPSLSAGRGAPGALYVELRGPWPWHAG